MSKVYLMMCKDLTLLWLFSPALETETAGLVDTYQHQSTKSAGNLANAHHMPSCTLLGLFELLADFMPLVIVESVSVIPLQIGVLCSLSCSDCNR